MFSFQPGYGRSSRSSIQDDTYQTTYGSSFNTSLKQTKQLSRKDSHLSYTEDKYSFHKDDDLSHPKLRAFHPVSRDWQEIQSKRLGLQVVKHNKYGPPKNYNDKSPPKDTISVRADGNCFFRAICVILTGAEDEHMKIREAVTKHVSDHPDMYRSFLQSRGGMSQYLSNMRRSREWATDVELLATATLLKTVIEVYFPYPVSKSETEYRWQTFKPLTNPDITYPVIYISNKHDHFDPVLDIDDSDLTHGHGQTSSDKHGLKTNYNSIYGEPKRHEKDQKQNHSHGAITF